LARSKVNEIPEHETVPPTPAEVDRDLMPAKESGTESSVMIDEDPHQLSLF
jgi:hypothetical protein